MTNDEFRREVRRMVAENAERDRMSGYKPEYNFQQMFRSVSHDDSKGGSTRDEAVSRVADRSPDRSAHRSDEEVRLRPDR